MVDKIKNSQNLKVYLSIGGCLLTILLLIFSCAKVHQITKKVNETKIRLEDLDSDITNLDKIMNDKVVYEIQIDKLYQSLPSNYYQVAYFARQLESIASNEGENIELKIDDDRKNEGDLSSLTFSVIIKGGYQSVKNTLSMLAQLPYHTSIDSLKTENEEGNLVTTVNFRLLMKK
ncbi:hypothetical protein A2159_01225 [Candidatus Woesebacteria bacterium RBG_13_34_9]|uniref:Uncharacterized protein n=1 Tax=Candidatus Woesebacteria bacterium RBG_13_34_9 TaxID=1802477 RepID=A0A1F7X1L5_9BACT|nr:MAG: hypothetical protein A2159_01225 [Candidatus Woesebacteria bacterium RBG_13_34_9]